jgi:hypothetical protein
MLETFSDQKEELDGPKYLKLESQRWSLRPKSKPMTDIFTRDTSIDCRKCSRTVPMKVLVLGLGRTGTACKFYQ